MVVACAIMCATRTTSTPYYRRQAALNLFYEVYVWYEGHLERHFRSKETIKMLEIIIAVVIAL